MSHGTPISSVPDIGGSVFSGFLGVFFAASSFVEVHPVMQFAAVGLSIVASSVSIYKAFKR
jgi:hypothetical protein